jgi:hypothetical protein
MSTYKLISLNQITMRNERYKKPEIYDNLIAHSIDREEEIK